jgi:hypothetical protein
MNRNVVLGCASNETYILGLRLQFAPRLRIFRGLHKLPVVYVLDGGVREAKLEETRLRAFAEFERTVCFIASDQIWSVFAGLPRDWGSSVMAYARLALPAMVSEPRIVYLDSDVIVQGDLSGLWDMDLGDAVIAAGLDLTAKDLTGANLPTRELGLSQSAPCLNSGRPSYGPTEMARSGHQWKRHCAICANGPNTRRIGTRAL